MISILNNSLGPLGVSRAVGVPIDLTDGLVGYWKMDGDVNDSSGLDQHGTTTGSPTFGSDYIELNGSSQYITLPSNICDPYSQGSIAAWMYIEDSGTAFDEMAIFSYADTASRNYKCFFRVRTEGAGLGCNIGFFLRRSNSSNQVSGNTAFGTVSRQTWHHVGVSQDGVTGLRFWVDGSEVAVDTVNQTGNAQLTHWFAINASAAERPAIGAVLDSGVTGFFKGRLKHVRLYSRPLDGVEWAALSNGGI